MTISKFDNQLQFHELFLQAIFLLSHKLELFQKLQDIRRALCVYFGYF
jgi:hypothetical protein